MAIKAIIGLGNPGGKFEKTRHNIGFTVLDELAKKYNASWKSGPIMETAQVTIKGHTVLLVKPQTYMNDSGKVIPLLNKQGIKADEILVVHDELELPFGTHKIKHEGSARGHNGVRSIISSLGEKFHRLRMGIGRPAERENVADYVLEKFRETAEVFGPYIDDALMAIEDILEDI